MPNHSTPKQRVEYGLDSIPSERTVIVSLRDLMYVHQTLVEFIQFFHQPQHYPDMKALDAFLGARGSGDAFDALSEARYHRMRNMLPPDITALLEEGVAFEHPLPPRYFERPS